MLTPMEKINQAKVMLMTMDDTVFFTSLLSYKKIVEEPGCETAWTDSIHIGYDPAFIDLQNVPQVAWILMHELGHCIYDHIPIAIELGLCMNTHNIAGDHYINLWNESMKELQEPAGIKIYKDRKYKGWSTMEIYKDILQQNNGKPPPQVGGMGSDLRKPMDMSVDEIKDRAMDDLAKAVIQAEMSNQPGSVPGAVRGMVEDHINPRLPWQTILQNHLSQYTRDDYSYSRPNKRFMPDFYMPSLHSFKLGHCICAKDVSGSITDEELGECDAEERYFWDVMKPSSMRSITFDTKIHQNKVFTEGEELDEAELSGGGGTNVKPVFKYVREEDPAILIIFTDGYFSMPSMDELTADIFWVIKGNPNFDPPHGEVIHLE